MSLTVERMRCRCRVTWSGIRKKRGKRVAFSTSPFSHNSERSGKGLDPDSPSSDTYGNRRTHSNHTYARLKPNPRSKSPARQQA
jgi:hypothetical protein